MLIKSGHSFARNINKSMTHSMSALFCIHLLMYRAKECPQLPREAGASWAGEKKVGFSALSLSISIYLSLSLYIYIYIHIYTHIYLSIYLSLSLYIYIYIYIHTYTRISFVYVLYLSSSVSSLPLLVFCSVISFISVLSSYI